MIIRIGRSRWKIENKNGDYEDNYGDGKKNLSMVFYLLNLLAFASHLILELGESLYQGCCKQEKLRETLTRMLLFESWQGACWVQFLDEQGAIS